MENIVQAVLEQVLARVKPPAAEREFVLKTVKTIVDELRTVAGKYGVDVEVEVEGSIAKDTWLSGARDVDIFLLFPTSISIENLRVLGLRIAKEAVKNLGGTYEEMYAQHPYIRGYVLGIEADIVPAYRVSSSDKIITAVDRTPFHTRYVKSRLDEKGRDEVRLLKQFMKGTGVYGAEVKVGGFSGYLAELLVIHYGSFINVLKAAKDWVPGRVIIDIEGYYRDMPAKRVFKMFQYAPLIVIDPVDKSRNAAAAVTLQRMLEFKVAARLFLEHPSLHFFFPPSLPDISIEDVLREVEKRKTSLVAIWVQAPRIPPDNLWAQLYRSLRGLEGLLERHEFRVVSKHAWTDEKEHCVFLFELLYHRLPPLERHEGPPVGDVEREAGFIEKYVIRCPEIVYGGPFIERGKWYVLKKRKYVTVKDLVNAEIEKIKHGANILKKIKERKYAVYVNEEIRELAMKAGNDFVKEVYKWLKRTYPWLCALKKSQ